MNKQTNSNKDKLINNLLNSPFQINEIVKYPLPNYGTSIGYIRKIENGVADIESFYGHKNENTTCSLNVLQKYTYMVGCNPFEDIINMVPINFSIESILNRIFKDGKYYSSKKTLIKSANFNPVVFDANNNPIYYQRGYVWDIDNKQALIESIYNGVDCGKIIVRERDWNEIDMLESKNLDFAFFDIVDGKQRLTAIYEFTKDVFSDINGNYFSDLSDYAQNKFLNNQLISYTEMSPNSKDADVIKTFLRMNFSGIPQSKEHLQYLKSINI